MTTTEIAALRCVRKMLVEMARSLANHSKNEEIANLISQVNKIHGKVFTICAPYHERKLP